jgi:hypothetical protein
VLFIENSNNEAALRKMRQNEFDALQLKWSCTNPGALFWTTLVESFPLWADRMRAAIEVGAKPLIMHGIIYSDGFDWMGQLGQGQMNFQWTCLQLGRGTRSDVKAFANKVILLCSQKMAKGRCTQASHYTDSEEDVDFTTTHGVEAAVLDRLIHMYSNECKDLQRGVLLKIDGELYFVVHLLYGSPGDILGEDEFYHHLLHFTKHSP